MKQIRRPVLHHHKAAVAALLLALFIATMQAATSGRVGHPLKGYVSITSNLVQGVKLHQATEAKKAKALPVFTSNKRRIQCPQCRLQGLTVYVEEQAIGYATDACVECDWRIETVWHCERGHQGANIYLAKGGKRERRNPQLTPAQTKRMNHPVQMVMPVDLLPMLVIPLPRINEPPLTVVIDPCCNKTVPHMHPNLLTMRMTETPCAPPPTIRHIPYRHNEGSSSMELLPSASAEVVPHGARWNEPNAPIEPRSGNGFYQNPEGKLCENWQVPVQGGIWHWIDYGGVTNHWFEEKP